MTDKEFRRLRRIELIDIIYKLQNNEEQLQAEIASLKQQMANRELKLSKVGSIAEAAMSLNGVFEAAQAAADQYITEVQKLHADTENQTAQMLSDAKAQAAEIVLAAERQRDAMLTDAKTEISEEEQRDNRTAETDTEL